MTFTGAAAETMAFRRGYSSGLSAAAEAGAQRPPQTAQLLSFVACCTCVAASLPDCVPHSSPLAPAEASDSQKSQHFRSAEALAAKPLFTNLRLGLPAVSDSAFDCVKCRYSQLYSHHFERVSS